MNFENLYSNIFKNSNLSNLPITFSNYDYTTYLNTPNIFNNTTQNIGINTNNPKYKLDVNGIINCSNLIINNKSFNINNLYTSNNIFDNTVYWNRIIDIKTQNPIILNTNNELKLNYNSNIFEIDSNNKFSLKQISVINSNNSNSYLFSGKISSISNLIGQQQLNSNISNLLAINLSNVRIANISNANAILNLSNSVANQELMIRFTDNTTGFNSNNGLIFGKNANNDCLFWNYYNADINFRISENNLLYSIFQKKIPWGIYFAEDYESSTNILYNYIRNNGRNATCTGTITSSWGNGNGANSNIFYITGGTTATINFGTGSLPPNFTLCSLTRYNGATKGRIINSTPGNFIHGHWNTYKGVCHYDGWKTIYGDRTLGNQNDWLCCIGRNNNSIPTNIICDGIPVGGNVGGVGGYNLTINTSEVSDWAFSLVMIWDQFLTDTEVFYLNKLVSDYTDKGISIRNIINKMEDFKISSNGNIGVGVINPQSLFEINGHLTTPTYYYSRTTTAIPTDTTSFTIRFTNLVRNLNMDTNIITYTSDATNGDYFTINKTGLYLINAILGNSNGSSYFWMDKNKASTVNCLNDTNTIIIKSKGVSNDDTISFRGILDATDVIRIKTSPISSLTASSRYSLNISFLMEVK
jgi:hypothetical protein